jgi:hypothetical protein
LRFKSGVVVGVVSSNNPYGQRIETARKSGSRPLMKRRKLYWIIASIKEAGVNIALDFTSGLG